MITPHVAGIDPSLTATGVAVVTPNRPWFTTLKTSGRLADTLADRDKRLAHIVDMIVDRIGSVDLTVIEGPAMARNNRGTWDRAGLWWRIVHRLHGNDIPVAVCPPAVRAKWATGRGNADKASIAIGVSRVWPAIEIGNDNEADALALATMGLQWLQPPADGLQRHTDALSAVSWPEYGVRVVA